MSDHDGLGAWLPKDGKAPSVFGLDRTLDAERFLLPARRLSWPERIAHRLRAVWRALRGWYDE